MTKREFMKRLDYYLKNLDYDEKIDIFNYYEEYFSELSISDDDEVPKNMDPYKIAKEILLDLGMNNIKKEKKVNNPLRYILLVLGTIFTLPISLPIIMVVFAFIAVIIALIVSFVSLFLAIPSFLVALVAGTVKYSFLSNNFLLRIGSILVIIGLLIIFFQVIIKIIRFILNVFAYIFTYVYEKLSGEKKVNNEKYKFERKIKLNDFNNIKIRDYVGRINVLKGDENYLKIKSSEYENIEIINEDNTLSIKTNGTIVKNEGDVITIYYNTDDISCNINDVVSKINFETADKSKLKFKDIVGTLNISIKDPYEVDLRVYDKIAKINIDKGIVITDNCDKHIIISDMIGKINIREVI